MTEGRNVKVGNVSRVKNNSKVILWDSYVTVHNKIIQRIKHEETSAYAIIVPASPWKGFSGFVCKEHYSLRKGRKFPEENWPLG